MSENEIIRMARESKDPHDFLSVLNKHSIVLIITFLVWLTTFVFLLYWHQK